VIELPSKRHQDFWIDALENWSEIGDAFVPILTIGGEDYSDRIPAGDWSQDGIAITFQALFIGGLPLELWDYVPVTLEVMLEGRIAPAMRGFTGLVDPQENSPNDQVTAASAGSLADKYDLNETVTWSGTRPDYAVRDALRRLPYNQGRVRVQQVSEPLLYAAPGHTEEAFTEDQKVNDLLSKVEEKVPFVFRDTAWGGHDASVSPGLARIPEIPDYLRFSSQDLVKWKSPALALQRYARVMVFKKNPDGSDAFEPAIANVKPLNPAFPTPAGLTERIPWTGDATSAQRHAYERALYLSRGQFANDPILPPFPLLERTDVFTVTETKIEEPGEGFYEREWIHYTDSFEQAWGQGLQTSPSCSVGLLNQQFVKAPTLNLGLITGGITKTAEPVVVGDFLTWGQTDLTFDDLTQTYGELN
jgi:hypothetical protein